MGSKMRAAGVIAEVFRKLFFAAFRTDDACLDRYLRNKLLPTCKLTIIANPRVCVRRSVTGHIPPPPGHWHFQLVRTPIISLSGRRLHHEVGVLRSVAVTT